MKDKSFEKAMNQIVGQHEAEQQEELRAEKRSRLFEQVRAVVVFLTIASMLVVTYNYRDALTTMILPKPTALFSITSTDGTNGVAAAPNTPQGQTANVLKAAQQNAATRDAIIDSIAK